MTNNISDKKCHCGKEFNKPYLLKRHQNSKYGCVGTIEYHNLQYAHNNCVKEKREREIKI